MRPIASVAVVIPCFNCSETIGRAVTSVLAQTRLPAQIILVDDCSTDSTYDVLIALALVNPCIKVLRNQKNGGPAVARNYGWTHATTNYVAFLDADDLWHPKKIETQIRYMEKYPDIFFSGHYVAVEGRRHDLIEGDSHLKRVSPRMMLFHNYFATSSIMIKRRAPVYFNAEKRRSEDYLLWLTLVFSGFKGGVINEFLATRYTEPFGQAGLSGNLLKMQGSELATFRLIWKNKHITALEFALAGAYSCIKFCRRAVLSGVRNGLLRKNV